MNWLALLLVGASLAAPGCAGQERGTTLGADAPDAGSSSPTTGQVPVGAIDPAPEPLADTELAALLEVRRLCRTDRDCPIDDRCCLAGALGTCVEFTKDLECPRPDLALLASPEWGPVFTEELITDATRCAIEKRCIGGIGLRRLLRFSVDLFNVGEADLILGFQGAQGVELAACDGLLYSDRVLRYELLDQRGALVAEAAGNATPDPTFAGGAAISPYGPELLGLRRKSYNRYSLFSDCQWLDVTTITPGSYSLRVTIHPDAMSFDGNPDNDVLELPVTVPERDPLRPCDSLETYYAPESLECGWSIVSPTNAQCAPGETIELDCTSCDRSPVLRVCDGVDTACSSLAALPFSPELCNSTRVCPSFTDCYRITFECPSSGTYTLLDNPAYWPESAPPTCER